jgi:hypothetical protein
MIQKHTLEGEKTAYPTKDAGKTGYLLAED